MTTPTLRGAKGFNVGASSSTTVNVTFPVTLAVGDEMFIWAGEGGSAAVSWSCSAPVSGAAFTAVTELTGTSDQAQFLYKVADAQDVTNAAASTSYPVVCSVAHLISVIAGAYSGTSGFDPTPTTSGQYNSSSTTLANAGITTTQDGDKLVWFGYTSIGAGGTPATITLPAGFTAQTTQSDANTTSASGTNGGMIMGDATQATHGATGAENGSLSSGHTNISLLIALQGPTGQTVNLPVAAVTVSAPVPSLAQTVSLPVAAVTVTAPAPTASTAPRVNLPVAAVTARAPVPTVAVAVRVSLPVATVSTAAPAPTLSVPTPSRVGSFITPTPNGVTWISGSGQTAQANAEAAWIADAGRPLTAERFYLGQQAMPTTTPAAVTNALNNGRRCLISYKPIINPSKLTSGNNLAPLSNTATPQATLDGEVSSLLAALNSSLTSAGLDHTYIVIDLWQEPYTVGHIGQTGKSTFADFVDMFRYYGPTIQAAGFKVAWCTSAGNGLAQHGEDATYPGDSFVDVCATDFYTGAYQTGSRLSGYDPNGGGGGNTSQYNPFYRGDNASPPKPCSIYETGGTLTLNNGISVTNFVTYMKGAFQHRASLGLPRGDIAWFNDGNDANDSPITSADGTTHTFSDPDNGLTEIRNALFAELFDAFDQSATGVGLPCAQVTVAAPAPTALVGGITRSLPVSQETIAAPAPAAVVGVALSKAQETIAALAPTVIVGVSLPRISNSIAGQPPEAQVGSTITPLSVAAETIAALAPTVQVGPVALALTRAGVTIAARNPSGVQAGPVSVALPHASEAVASLTPALKLSLPLAVARETTTALAPAPGLSLALPVARISVNAPPVTVNTSGLVRALTTGNVSAAAYSPAASLSVGLAVANESVTAPSPSLTVTVALAAASQSVAALPLAVSVPALVQLAAAQMAVSAYVPILSTGGEALGPEALGGSVTEVQVGGSVTDPVTGGGVT